MMPLRIAAGAADAGRGADAGPDAIAAWLDILTPMLAMPEHERAEVRDELKDHLLQRVRDLMLAGEPEPAAVSVAIGELGDAASLARQWSRARRNPKRSLIMGMTLGITGLAGAAVVAMIAVGGMGHAGLGTGNDVGVTVFQPAVVNEGSVLAELRVSGEQNELWLDFVARVGAAGKMPVTAQWAQLGAMRGNDNGVKTESPWGVTFTNLTLTSALNLLNDTAGLPIDDGVQVRAIDGSLVFAPASYFDKIETVMVSYDLSKFPDIEIGGDAGTQSSLRDAITSMAYPDLWRTNGGDRAVLQEIGTTLLIKAPKRVHEQVAWIIKSAGELGKAGKHSLAPMPKDTGIPVESRSTTPVELAPVPAKLPGLTPARSDHLPGETRIMLKQISAADFRGVLGSYFDVAPGLKRCDFVREMEANDGVFMLRASQRQAELARAIAEVIDCPAKPADNAAATSKRFNLAHAKAQPVAEWLNNVFKVSPFLKVSPVQRSIAADQSDNSIVFASTADQVEAVGRLVNLCDQRDNDTPISAAAEQIFGAPKVIALSHADAATLAPVIATRMVEVAQQTSGQILVIAHPAYPQDKDWNAVVIAGDRRLVDQAEMMAHELDRAIGLTGHPAADLSVRFTGGGGGGVELQNAVDLSGGRSAK